MPSLPVKNKTLVKAVENHAKTDNKIFWCDPVLLDFLIMPQIIGAIVYVNNFLLITCLSLLQTPIFDIFYNVEAFSKSLI